MFLIHVPEKWAKFENSEKQAGAELGQAQYKLGLALIMSIGFLAIGLADQAF